jgi:hypothetical protein
MLPCFIGVLMLPSLQARKLRFEMAIKRYCFHFIPTVDQTQVGDFL